MPDCPCPRAPEVPLSRPWARPVPLSSATAALLPVVLLGWPLSRFEGFVVGVGLTEALPPVVALP